MDSIKSDPISFFQNPPHKCLVKCTYEEGGILVDGVFQYDMMKDYAAKISPAALSILQNCIDTMHGDDLCETAVNFLDCKFKAHQSMQ